jgi:hypothetical protein
MLPPPFNGDLSLPKRVGDFAIQEVIRQLAIEGKDSL